jgi:hypothetical protein
MKINRQEAYDDLKRKQKIKKLLTEKYLRKKYIKYHEIKLELIENEINRLKGKRVVPIYRIRKLPPLSGIFTKDLKS